MTRYHSSQPCEWVSPRPKSGLHNTHKLERIRPAGEPPLWVGVLCLLVLCGVVWGAAAIIGPVFEPVPDTYSTQGAGGSNVPGSE